MDGHIAVLSNPTAGKGRARRAAIEAAVALRDAGATLREYSGSSVAETRMLAADALAHSPSVLVVVGGDGTLSGILDVVCDSGVPVAVVPAGTGNDLARALDLPRDDVRSAALVALSGRVRRIDVGEVRSSIGTRSFLTVAALGFDAKVSDRTDRLRWPRGRLRYYLALVVELFRLRPMRFRISLDGGTTIDAPGTLIAVGNTPSYGGGMPMCVGARPDDGTLDVVAVAPLGRLRLLRVFPRLLRGQHLDLPEVSHRQARTVAVAAPGLVVYADGESVATSDCEIVVRASALPILVPAD